MRIAVRLHAGQPFAPPHTVEDILAGLLRAGAADDRADDAEEEVAGLRARIRRVHETLKAAGAPRPRVAVLASLDPLDAAGYWVPDQVKRAGGIDVLAAVGAPPPAVTAGQVRAADPQVVIIAPRGSTLADAAAAGLALMERPAWSWLRARRTWALDGGALTGRPGPHVVDGIEVMARIFNDALFTALDGSRAERLA
ncbi:MAG: TroA family protein [Gemmatimonadaceae bacterium]